MASPSSPHGAAHDAMHAPRFDSSGRVTSTLDDDWEEWNGTEPFWVHAVAGSFAGVAEHTVMFPVDTIKTFVQAESAGGVEAVRAMVQREGVRRLWRGASSMLYGCAPAHAGYFSIYEWGKVALGADGPDHAPLAAAGVGALATLAHDAVMTPADVLKQRMQLGFHRSVGDALRTIVRKEGVLALYRSYPTVIAMNIPFAATSVSVNESMKRMLNASGEYSAPASLASGLVAGAVAGAVTTPLDVVRTRLQTQSLLAEMAAASSEAAAAPPQPQSAFRERERERRHLVRAHHHAPPGSVAAAAAPATPAPAPTPSVAASYARRFSPSATSIHSAFLLSRKVTGRVSLTASHFANALVPQRSNGTAAPSTAFVTLPAQGARPKYTRPQRCPLPIALWASPGTSTWAATQAGPASARGAARAAAAAAAAAAASPSPAAAAAPSGRSAYAGPVEVATAIWRKEGLRGFFRGATQRVTVQAPAVAISWTAYETAKEVLFMFAPPPPDQ